MSVVTSARPRAGSNFELWSWYFMRVSGILLVVLVLVHLAIMHVLNPIEAVDFNFVASRWASPFWRIYDWLLLILAFLHGLNGTRVVIDDYVHTKGWRVVTLSVLYVVGLILMVIGSLVILTFQA